MARRRDNRQAIDRIASLVTQHVDELVVTLTIEVRRVISREIVEYFGNGSAGYGASDRVARRTSARRALPCISPACKSPSKGPRFHYLCEKHRGAPRKDYEAWQAARQSANNARRA